MSWWRNRGLLADFIGDLIHAELAKLRPGQPLAPRPWPQSLELGAGGLDMDSLERLTVAAALGQALRLDRSGLEDHLLARSSIGAWVDLATVCLERYDGSLVFLTSGSSGEPKRCEHRLADLWQEATVLAGLFKDRRRVVSAVSCRHIYGFLFTILLPDLLGVPVCRRVDQSTVTLGADLHPGDLVIGFPDFWRLATRSLDRFADDVVGVTSTAPLPRDLDGALLDRGLRRLVEIYGASETAGIGWREAPAPDFQLFPFWTRASDGGSLIRHRPEGDEACVVAQDRLDWRAERRFAPAGRLDQAFQVGGVNVHPQRVVDVLTRHPDVAEASVRLMRPEEGGRVKAFIVARGTSPDPAALATRLDAWASAHLSAPERPKAYRFGDTLPRDGLGKSVDWS